MKYLFLLVIANVSACSSGCVSQGYASGYDLEQAKMGPESCQKRCEELGMRMGALALIDAEHAGCVCIPNASEKLESSVSQEESAGATVAASGMLIAQAEQQRQQQAAEAARQQQQRQQQQQQTSYGR